MLRRVGSGARAHDQGASTARADDIGLLTRGIGSIYLHAVARLSATERANLPDSAFAYVDSRGRRRLPINDESHVRNALARFEQVRFEDEAARERARKRLLNAAKKYGIVPVGFITGQLETERRHAVAGRIVIEMGRLGAAGDLERHLRSALRDPTLAVLHWSEAAGAYLDGTGRPTPLPGDGEDRAVTMLERQGRPMTALVHDPAVLDDPALADTVLGAVRYVIERESHLAQVASSDPATLPTGFVTMLLTDIEGSTALLRRMGDDYAALLGAVRRVIHRGVIGAGGREVEVRADETFSVFERVGEAIEAAVGIQRSIGSKRWPGDVTVRVRMGMHSGPITLTETGYIGLAVHTAARVSAMAHGGQILVSRETKEAMESGPAMEVGFRSLGPQRLAGLPEDEELFQLIADGLGAEFPPPRPSKG